MGLYLLSKPLPYSLLSISLDDGFNYIFINLSYNICKRQIYKWKLVGDGLVLVIRSFPRGMCDRLKCFIRVTTLQLGCCSYCSWDYANHIYLAKIIFFWKEMFIEIYKFLPLVGLDLNIQRYINKIYIHI